MKSNVEYSVILDTHQGDVDMGLTENFISFRNRYSGHSLCLTHDEFAEVLDKVQAYKDMQAFAGKAAA